MTKPPTRRTPRSRPPAVATTTRPSRPRARGTNSSPRARARGATASAVIAERIGSTPALRAAVEDHKLSSRIAEMIFAGRTSAGLSQKELAERVGTTQSVISRLEDADYGGHSLSMLQRIAEALGLRLDVSWSPGKA